MSVLTWSAAEDQANNILRRLMGKVKYGYAYRKLNHARWHLIEPHTTAIPDDEWTDQRVVSNRDVFAQPAVKKSHAAAVCSALTAFALHEHGYMDKETLFRVLTEKANDQA